MKKNLTSIQKKRVNLVRLWMASFIPLLISAILFVFCFIFETEIWLYAICMIVFLIFVVLYMRGEKSIKHEDGYTLIQAMHFYLVCLKEGGEYLREGRHPLMYKIAKKLAYAKGLESRQVELMYKIGQELVVYFKLERLSEDV